MTTQINDMSLVLEECRADCIAADTCCNANVGNPSPNSGCGQGSCLQVMDRAGRVRVGRERVGRERVRREGREGG